MRRFLFQYLELFSVVGDGTPQNPGGDFDMSCWIEAPDKQAALEWGYVLLGRYVQARYAHSSESCCHDEAPIREGEIVEDPEMIAVAEHWNLPSCRMGEVPRWHEPWRISNIRRGGPAEPGTVDGGRDCGSS